MATRSGSKVAIVAAVIGNLAIATIKFIAAVITGSSAMISEGIHSLVDTGNGGLLLHGMNRAKKPPDKLHPFGYGKALYFWTLVVSVSIFGIGGGLSLYEGISHIRHVAPGMEMYDPTINYIVLGLAVIIEGWTFSVALREFSKVKGKRGSWEYIRGTKDPTTYTVLLEDSAALLGLIFAFLGIFFGHMLGNPYLDGVASVLIGLLLMCVAFILAFETKSLLLGEGVDSTTLEKMRQIVENDPQVESVAEVLTMYMGPHDLLLNIGVCFKKESAAEQVHQSIDRIEKNIRSAYPECIRIYIEAESIAGKNCR